MVIIRAIINLMNYSTIQVNMQANMESLCQKRTKKWVKMKGKTGKNRCFCHKKVCRLTKRHTLGNMSNLHNGNNSVKIFAKISLARLLKSVRWCKRIHFHGPAPGKKPGHGRHKPHSCGTKSGTKDPDPSHACGG